MYEIGRELDMDEQMAIIYSQDSLRRVHEEEEEYSREHVILRDGEE